jgi:GNAT superfamily N-acetyltransferase
LKIWNLQKAELVDFRILLWGMGGRNGAGVWIVACFCGWVLLKSAFWLFSCKRWWCQSLCTSQCECDMPKSWFRSMWQWYCQSCPVYWSLLYAVAVRESCRRQGYGEALLQSAIQQIQARRLQCVNLHVDPTRVAAVALYEKIGFHVDTVVHSYYAPNRDAYRMVLELS